MKEEGGVLVDSHFETFLYLALIHQGEASKLGFYRLLEFHSGGQF